MRRLALSLEGHHAGSHFVGALAPKSRVLRFRIGMRVWNLLAEESLFGFFAARLVAPRKVPADALEASAFVLLFQSPLCPDLSRVARELRRVRPALADFEDHFGAAVGCQNPGGMPLVHGDLQEAAGAEYGDGFAGGAFRECLR